MFDKELYEKATSKQILSGIERDKLSFLHVGDPMILAEKQRRQNKAPSQKRTKMRFCVDAISESNQQESQENPIIIQRKSYK